VPGLTTVQRADLHPGDVLVAEIAGHATKVDMDAIRAALSYVFPRNKIIVLCDGLTLKVVRDA
jgi:pyruvoyl-dependent arginine decarboxylase (PvlArgDC)